jgi:hypothetical protein
MKKFEIRCPDWINDTIDEIESYDHGDAAEDWVESFEYNHVSFNVASGDKEVIVYVRKKNEDNWIKFSVFGITKPIYIAEELDDEV